MNKLTLTAIAVTLALCGSVSTAIAADYQVTVTNLTSGIFFTPLIASTHAPAVSMFTSGSPASSELQALAEGGNIGPMAALLESVGASVATGDGLLAPGATATFMLSNSGSRDNTVLSVAGMLLPTNDGFVGLNSVHLPMASGPASMTWNANGYDAGTEANDELVGSGAPGEAGFPAPPPIVASGTGVGGQGVPTTVEGFVHIHRNVLGDLEADGGPSDINAAVHRWLNPVARITVTRMDADGGEGPEAVSGLNGIAYSASSIEIFWDRASSSNFLVTAYEIYRNGVLVDTLDALSYFDDSLNADTAYEYEVRAMDSNGARGPSAMLNISTRL
ncbi:MAG: hypothetical protein ACI8VW_000003 [bacterium]|jgi:hypothetical protein